LEGGLVPKLVWRVKLVAELEPGVTTETEVACLERGEEAGLADLGLRLDEAKQLTAARAIRSKSHSGQRALTWIITPMGSIQSDWIVNVTW
jgi:hypothetical protein